MVLTDDVLLRFGRLSIALQETGTMSLDKPEHRADLYTVRYTVLYQ